MTTSFIVLMILIIYMPFHFFEEAMGNFPEWMFHHWTPHRLTYGQWMANNVFLFYPVLVIAYLLFYFQQTTLVCIGGGILFWGIINFFDHLFYTIKDRKISPGLFTGLLNCLNGVYGFKLLFFGEKIEFLSIVISVVIGIILFLVPTILSKTFDPIFQKKFGK